MNDFDGALTKSLDDFMESYKITDTEKIYSNGMELVPIFRVKQWEEYNKDKEIERLNNIIKQQNTRNSRQRIANRKLQEENNLLKQIIGNDKKYSYGIRMGSDKE